jgi:integrase/recombinase XerC
MPTAHHDTTNSDVHSTGTDDGGRARTWLKPDQVEQLRDGCLTDTCPTYLQDRDETIITLAYDAGLRAGELAGLDVEHVDLDAGTLYLPTSIQKGSPPPATLELERDTVRTLRRYLRDRWKDTAALFPTRSSDRITTRSLRRLVEKLAVAADVEPQVAGGGVGEPDDVTPHTLRHSVAYRIIQVDGGRLEDVQLRLRHANRRTTDRVYSHLVPR